METVIHKVKGLKKEIKPTLTIFSKALNASVNNLAQSGASEYLITAQVEEAVKKKPDLIVIGHTSEYRWQVWDFRRNQWQGFIVANHVLKNEKYYRNWILSEQILGNKRKDTAEHQAAWHAAGTLYFQKKRLSNDCGAEQCQNKYYYARGQVYL